MELNSSTQASAQEAAAPSSGQVKKPFPKNLEWVALRKKAGDLRNKLVDKSGSGSSC